MNKNNSLVDLINETIDNFMEIANKDQFEDLDSLDHMELIMDIEETLDINIPISDLEGTPTREQMVQMSIDASGVKC